MTVLSQRCVLEHRLDLRVCDIANHPDLVVEAGLLAVKDMTLGSQSSVDGFMGNERPASALPPSLTNRGIAPRPLAFVLDLKHDGLVYRIPRIGTRIDAELDDRISPRTRAEHVTDILIGVFGNLTMLFIADLVRQGPACPERPIF